MFGMTKLADDKIKVIRFVVKDPKHVATPSVLGTVFQPHEEPSLLLHNKKSMQLRRRLGSET